MSTKIVVALTLLVSVIAALGWFRSNKTYLTLGFTWLGYKGIGIGFFEGKIFWSSIITFALSFALAFFLMAERSHQTMIPSLVISGLTVLSGAYLFEFVYLYLEQQALLKYTSDFRFWLPLVTGLAVGFSYRFMRVNKVTLSFLSLFIASMVVWYLGGYPQLEHKEENQLVVPYHDFLGIPADWSLPLNILAKLFACLTIVGLLYGPLRTKVPVALSSDSTES